MLRINALVGNAASAGGRCDHDDMVGLAISLLWWIVPIAIVIYVLRALGTIVEGLRSVNVGVQKTAAAVEEMVRRLPPE